MQELFMELGERSYKIAIGNGLLKNITEYFNLNRKVFILTDTGVPKEYSEAVKIAAKNAKILTVNQGECAKSLTTLEHVLEEMLEFEMGRSDVLVSVGGGVIGDLGGFAASVFMRGIDFYNVPTTLLSMVDSSIGGKTAVNLGNVKNIVGAFHQPKAVLIDTATLSTLPKRQISNGMAESLKMALTSDAALFEKIESEGFTRENAEDIITASLKIKKAVVEQDECETGLRKILNFGHTLGHGIEACEKLSGLYHGECVALGIIPLTDRGIRQRVISVLEKTGLPVNHKYDLERALAFVKHDKKCKDGYVSVIFVDEIGTFRMEKLTVSDFEKIIRAEHNNK